MPLNTYLHCTGNAEEMLEFYRSALGGTVEISRYQDAPKDARPEGVDGWDDKVMYGRLDAPNGTTLSAMDAPPGRQPHAIGDNFSLAYVAANEVQARDAFERLSLGAAIYMPMAPTFFSECFGMLQDRYKIQWMVMVEATMPGAA